MSNNDDATTVLDVCIKEKVYYIIQSSLDEPQKELNDNIPFSELSIGSLAYIKMIVSLEDEFGFEFDDEKLVFTAFPFVASIVEYIIENIK